MGSGHPWPSVLRTAGRTGAQIGSPADLSNPGGFVHTSLSAKQKWARAGPISVWRWTQSGANPSPRNSLFNWVDTGNSLTFLTLTTN